MGSTLEQLLANEKPEVVAQAQKMAEELLLNIRLGEIRNLMDKTQQEMAQRLGVKQSSVAVMEKPGRNLQLASLKRFVEAGGGKVSLDIELQDGSHHAFPL